MALTYEPIYTTVTGSDTTTINITGIPQTYSDLILSMTTRAQQNSPVLLQRINNSASYTYSFQRVAGTGGTVSSISALNDPSVELGQMGNTGIANANFGLILEFPEYTNTSTNRVWVYSSAGIGTTVDQMRISQGAAMNTNTSAITQINFYNATFDAGTSITLWGVLKA